MKVIDVFEQPRTDDHIYVVVEGATGKDIACYCDNEYTKARGNTIDQIAANGTKLSEYSFRQTAGWWHLEDDGYYYRT